MLPGNKNNNVVKVELRQENRDRKAGRVPITLQIRSNETILPEAASDYEVGLLKFVTAFDSPSFHIPEDQVIEVKLWEIYTNIFDEFDYRHISTSKMSGSFHGVKGFCDQFNEAHRNSLQLTFDETNERMTIKLNHKLEASSDFMMVSINEGGKSFLGKHFNVSQYTASFPYNQQLYTLRKSDPFQYTFQTNEKVESHSDDYSDFYNFDHIQLMTDLPISQTLASTSSQGRVGADDTAGDTIVKISTLGNITTNPSVEEAYARGGLLHLPNFKIISSLTSDTPLTNFKITPYIFYRTGHSEPMVLSVGSSCYTLIEFTPREKL